MYTVTRSPQTQSLKGGRRSALPTGYAQRKDAVFFLLDPPVRWCWGANVPRRMVELEALRGRPFMKVREKVGDADACYRSRLRAAGEVNHILKGNRGHVPMFHITLNKPIPRSTV